MKDRAKNFTEDQSGTKELSMKKELLSTGTVSPETNQMVKMSLVGR